MFKAIPHFLFYQIQFIWFYVEVFDPFGLDFCSRGYGWIYFYSSTFRHPVWPASFVEDTVFFQVCVCSFFIKNQLSLGVWIYVWVFNLIPLINMSLFVPIPWCFYYCISVVQLEIGDRDTSHSSFIIQYYFRYPEFFVFPCEALKNVLSKSVGIVMELIDLLDCFQ